jgi:hypothetical protein
VQASVIFVRIGIPLSLENSQPKKHRRPMFNADITTEIEELSNLIC